MEQFTSHCYFHIIFNVKYKNLLIRKADLPNIYAYIGCIIRQYGSSPIQINGAADHIHILCSMPNDVRAEDFIQGIKSMSCEWIKKIASCYRRFSWYDGYAAFSVGLSHLKELTDYIADQEAYHRKCPFKKEYIALLKENGITFDEKHLWDD